MSNAQTEIYENYEEYLIGIDDEFSFKCRSCGKCCRNRHDILLSAKDLYNMARHLGISIIELLKTYCNTYVGHDSKMPITRLQPIGGNSRCPFLDKRKCRVHEAKPVVCAMYPIGRMIEFNEKGDPIIEDGHQVVRYLNVKPDCEHKQRKQTVREWIGRWGITDSDPFYGAWNRVLSKMTVIFRMLVAAGGSDADLAFARNIVFDILYVQYNLEGPFMPQFEANVARVGQLLDGLQADAEKTSRLIEERDENGI